MGGNKCTAFKAELKLTYRWVSLVYAKGPVTTVGIAQVA